MKEKKSLPWTARKGGNPSDLVIADGDDKAACVAGVMGGFDSEVTAEAKRTSFWNLQF